jgi:3-deoxy-manno-octulosonate cytidylyltransferase (CMP-KDO synthetase)
MSKKIAIIIPARYASARFPGKPLADIAGKSLILRVWEQCSLAIGPQDVYVATEDNRIQNHCLEHSMQVLMTSNTCLTGTDRIAEAYDTFLSNEGYDYIVNVQGDEPLVKPEDIRKVIDTMIKTDTLRNVFHFDTPPYVYCGYCRIETEEEFKNPNVPKVVFNQQEELLYISRAPIPTNKKLELVEAYRQVCIYGFIPTTLSRYYTIGKKSKLEAIEDIEILRFMEEFKYPVKMVEVLHSIAVDIPEDIYKVINILKKR